MSLEQLHQQLNSLKQRLGDQDTAITELKLSSVKTSEILDNSEQETSLDTSLGLPRNASGAGAMRRTTTGATKSMKRKAANSPVLDYGRDSKISRRARVTDTRAVGSARGGINGSKNSSSSKPVDEANEEREIESADDQLNFPVEPSDPEFEAVMGPELVNRKAQGSPCGTCGTLHRSVEKEHVVTDTRLFEIWREYSEGELDADEVDYESVRDAYQEVFRTEKRPPKEFLRRAYQELMTMGRTSLVEETMVWRRRELRKARGCKYEAPDMSTKEAWSFLRSVQENNHELPLEETPKLALARKIVFAPHSADELQSDDEQGEYD